MTRGALHLERPRAAGTGLDSHASYCGRSGKAGLVSHPAETTCQQCLRAAKAQTLHAARERAHTLGAPRHGRIAAKALLLEHAAEVLDGAPVDATADTEPAPSGWYVPTRGTTSLDADARAVLAREGRDKPAARWSTVRAALERATAHTDEGASVSNSIVYKWTADEKGGSPGTREGRVSNVERGVDDVVGVIVALERAYAGGVFWPAPRIPQPHVYLSPALCREILVWRLVGRPVQYLPPTQRRPVRVTVEALPDSEILALCEKYTMGSASVYVMLAARAMQDRGHRVRMFDPVLVEQTETGLVYEATPALAPMGRAAAIRRVSCDTETIVEMASAVAGCPVTPHHVSLVVRQGTAEIREALERAGEMMPARRVGG